MAKRIAQIRQHLTRGIDCATGQSLPWIERLIAGGCLFLPFASGTLLRTIGRSAKGVDAVTDAGQAVRRVGGSDGLITIEQLLRDNYAIEVENHLGLRQYPVYKQPSGGGCLPTCVRMIEESTERGLCGPLDDILQQAGEEGLSPEAVIKFIESRGWTVEYKFGPTKSSLADIDDAMKMGYHVILDVEPDAFSGNFHAMLVLGVQGNPKADPLDALGITFNDPMTGKIGSMKADWFATIPGRSPSYYVIK